MVSSGMCVFSKRSIDFNHPTRPYPSDKALTDFGNMTSGWNESRAFITRNQCQIKLCKNALSASGGMIAKYDIAPCSEYTANFMVKFHSDFEWCSGGKLGAGFFIGDGPAGGKGCHGSGGSARLVWHKHPSTGEVYLQAYAYHTDQSNQYGTCFGRYPPKGSLAKNQWYEITICVRSNTGNMNDGCLRVTAHQPRAPLSRSVAACVAVLYAETQ